MTSTSNICVKPSLMLKKSTSNQWVISVLLVGKSNSLPIWDIDNLNKTSNINYSNWNLIHTDKLSINDLYFYQSDIICDLLALKSSFTFNLQYTDEAYSNVINLPKIGEMPQITYSSCHGFSEGNIANKFAKDKNAMLENLFKLSSANKFELCLMGGDQIYSDEIFVLNEHFKKWTEKNLDEQVNSEFTDAMHKEAKQCYLHLYIRNWTESFHNIITSMPAIMMWDDHDIIDGWGSYDEQLQNSDIHQGLYKIAELYFCIFQQHRLPQTKLVSGICSSKLKNEIDNKIHDNKSNFYILGNVALLNLDLRSERNFYQIISDNSWKEIFNHTREVLSSLQNSEEQIKHLFIMSSIPVAYPDFRLLEKMLGILPMRQELEDDLHDHWSSIPHLDERRKLVVELIEIAILYYCRVTILSGDVHIAANGLIQSHRTNHCKNARSINQLISSGIIHPPPPAIVVLAIDHLMKNKGEIVRDIVYEMLDMPNLQKNFVVARNFISLCDEGDTGVKVAWHIENEPYPLIKWIRRVNPSNSIE